MNISLKCTTNHIFDTEKVDPFQRHVSMYLYIGSDHILPPVRMGFKQLNRQ